ncbi:hypothetical protein M441DRAFT_61660 [Trichoderma asperellum CBS 433.97]|uniref:Secreted protein n=1 Tax=Trichoderma asperellum (strain ATCC 204424 / CBS 433.97 / NBRC 101777) TaxID=1042311 RepID=A0A2T3YWK8_TRIA4|nr:hypothetical protein M441DRAFT_61660 [Trichoderma asperellum CBS 433.97]PTB36936.1 hypothetical protein M441DRAFT_61660 [Trichoderma asperellum CBS 433.97]
MACVILLWRLRNTTALAPTLRRTRSISLAPGVHRVDHEHGMGSRPGVSRVQGWVALRAHLLSVRCGNDSIVLTPDQERLKGLGAARPTASEKLVPRSQTMMASS